MPTPSRSTTTPFLTVPPRIAIAGDWHADAEYAVEAIHYAKRRNASVLLHLGDFGYDFTDKYLRALDDALASTGMVLAFVDGNHENFDRLLQWPIADDGLRYLRERVIHLPRGYRWQWGGTQCLAVGGAYSIDRLLRIPHRSWWPQETITPTEAAAICEAGRCDVMFCHDCPSGVLEPWADRDHHGFPIDELERAAEHRALLRTIVDVTQPSRLWHGHFHHRYRGLLDGNGYRTVVDGLGRNGDPIDNNMVVVNLADLGWHRLSIHAGEPSCSA